MDSRGDKAMTEGIHFQERCKPSTVTKIIPVMPLRKRRAGEGFHGDDSEIRVFSMEFIHEEGETGSGEVTPTADAAADDIRVLIQELELLF